MNENYSIGVFWKVRQETAEAAADKLSKVFPCLIAEDPRLSTWYHRYKKPSALDADSLKNLLLKGQHYTSEGYLIPELGFGTSLFSFFQDEQDVHLGVHCGEDALPPANWNDCVLRLPEQYVKETPISRWVTWMACLVDIWQPDHGALAPSKYWQLAPKMPRWTPRIGWMTYLRIRPDDLAFLSPDYIVRPMGEAGCLIIVTEERFTVSNPEHVEKANGLVQLLQARNLLKPVVSSEEEK